jgi:hypothetical protein
MPGFKNTIPQPNDDLSVSQGDLRLNFQSCNTSFGIDHYPFTDLTANDGKHNQVTTPIITPNAYPTTAASEPKFFAFAESQVGSTLPLGALQYSRGPSNAVPTPITFLQSPVLPITLASNTATNIVDFTGLKDCMFMAYATITNTTNPLTSTQVASGHYFLPSAVKTIRLVSLTPSGFIDGGNGILQYKNTSSGSVDIYWTVQILRITQ